MSYETYLLIAILFIMVALAKYIESKMKKRTDADIEKRYRSRWLFSENEKGVFISIKEITDKEGMYLFAKVRLFDLIEPKFGESISFTNKIKSKHVDFVVCDKHLVATHVIELDDRSHDRPDRRERDTFVDAVLTNCGYKVLHIRAINQEQITSFLRNAL